MPDVWRREARRRRSALIRFFMMKRERGLGADEGWCVLEWRGKGGNDGWGNK